MRKTTDHANVGFDFGLEHSSGNMFVYRVTAGVRHPVMRLDTAGTFETGFYDNTDQWAFQAFPIQNGVDYVRVTGGDGTTICCFLRSARAPIST